MRELEKGKDLAQRLLRFGAATLKHTPQLRQTPEGRHIAMEWLRSATSAGANYEEARAAESAADFAHKVSVAAKEAREARYWLCLVAEAGWIKSDLTALIRESGELTAMLLASARTARKNLRRTGVRGQEAGP